MKESREMQTQDSLGVPASPSGSTSQATAIPNAHTPMAEVANNFIFCIRKRDDGTRWPVGTKLYAQSSLIEAAPELLEVLTAMRDTLHRNGYATSAADAVIAKATGTQA